MKKTKLLTLTLVVAIMMVGAGYALWTDRLEINSTVSTGTFDVDFTGLTTLACAPDPEEVTVKSFYVDRLTTDADDNGEDKDEIIVTLENLYPTAKVVRHVVLENVGSVSAKLDRFTLKSTDLLNPNATTETPILKYMNVSLDFGDKVSKLRAFPNHHVFTENAVNPGGLPAGAEVLSIAKELPASVITLAPGAKVEFDLIFELKHDAPNNTTEGQKAQFNVFFDYGQLNINDGECNAAE